MAPSKHSNEPISRQDRKAKKRKLEDAVPDLPGGHDADNEEGGAALDMTTTAAGTEERLSKKARKEDKKKAKKNAIGGEVVDGEERMEEEQAGAETGKGVVNLLGEVEAPRKSKKERKAERKAKDAAAKASGNTTTEEVHGTTATVTDDASREEPGKQNTTATADAANSKKDKSSAKPNNAYRDKKRAEKAEKRAANPAYTSKFIVFVGNLPFTATTASIQKHFGTVKPKSIRHLTKKDDPTKSRGCAFVEFDDYTQMESALRLFHHSLFEGRKINVELTAGGGGNTEKRRQKIEQKNSKLTEERLRKVQDEEKAKWAKKKESGEVAADSNGIHPSRRGRIPGQ